MNNSEKLWMSTLMVKQALDPSDFYEADYNPKAEGLMAGIGGRTVGPLLASLYAGVKSRNTPDTAGGLIPASTHLLGTMGGGILGGLGAKASAPVLRSLFKALGKSSTGAGQLVAAGKDPGKLRLGLGKMLADAGDSMSSPDFVNSKTLGRVGAGVGAGLTGYNMGQGLKGQMESQMLQDDPSLRGKVLRWLENSGA